MQQKIFISGPLHANYSSAVELWSKAGFVPVTHHELANETRSTTWTEGMRYCLGLLLDCRAIALLPGWEQSVGATLEARVASALDMPFFDAKTAYLLPDPFKTEVVLEEAKPEETILQEADRLVNGQRQGDYGHPLDDFTKTGKIWEAILGVPVTPEQVGLCMVGVKLSREMNRPKRDNLVDGIGYLLTVDMIHKERERRASA